MKITMLLFFILLFINLNSEHLIPLSECTKGRITYYKEYQELRKEFDNLYHNYNKLTVKLEMII